MLERIINRGDDNRYCVDDVVSHSQVWRLQLVILLGFTNKLVAYETPWRASMYLDTAEKALLVILVGFGCRSSLSSSFFVLS